jgi:hypothetical protein
VPSLPFRADHGAILSIILGPAGISTTGNGGSQYQRLLLAELERHSEQMQALDTKVNEIRQKDLADIKVQIAMLQIKSGLWGAAAGMLPALLLLLTKYLSP